MRDVTIQDYIGTHKELTAEQVRKLPVGTKIIRHSFDRYGNHAELEMTVQQSYKKKVLVARDYYRGERIERAITAATDRMCYTEVEEDE